ncbi:MAG TPA: hypothetical protein VIK59_12480 [Verrucomicrobiae bacterium]
MKRLRYIFEILFFAGIFCGCAQVQNSPPTVADGPDAKKIELCNNAASLLYGLLDEEKNVSKVLIFKGNSAALGQLIKAISKSAGDGEKQLAAMAKNDSALNLHALELPAGEKATRAAIAKTREHELLFSSGENFEFTLLLTQAEALSYGSHLAKIAAENCPPPVEAREFHAFDVALNDLFQQVLARMRSLPPK